MSQKSRLTNPVTNFVPLNYEMPFFRHCEETAVDEAISPLITLNYEMPYELFYFGLKPRRSKNFEAYTEYSGSKFLQSPDGEAIAGPR